MFRKKRKNPLGDLAHFDPFGPRGQNNSQRRLRRNVDEDYRNLQQRAEIGDEEAIDKLEALDSRISGSRPKKGLWEGIGETFKSKVRPTYPMSQIPKSGQMCNRPKHNFSPTSFSSTKEARAFLEFKVPEMGPQECSANVDKIKAAEKVVAKADKRNQKRKLRRTNTPERETLRPKKELVHYEELSGPDGGTIRFKLLYQEGQFVKRIRTSEEPPIGATILDLTCGVKAWKRYSDKRRGIPLSKEMKRSYENSLLFKVRQFAAGKITFQQLCDKISASKSGSKSKSIFKKVRRKNRKNR